MTLPEQRHADIAAGLAAITAKLDTYVERHDQQHDELCSQHDALRAEHHDENRELAQLVKINTTWRLERQAWEKVGRYVIGTNLGVLVGLVVVILALLQGP